MIRLAAIAFAGLAVTNAAMAQAPALGESAKEMIGSWEFSNADRDKKCTATFSGDRTTVGFKVEFDANCAGQFPLVADIVGWTFPDNDLLHLLDAQGKVLVEFSEVEDGIYEAPTPGVGVLFLQNAAAAAGPPEKPPEELAGNWLLTPRIGRAALRPHAGVHGARRRHGADGEAGLRGVDRAAQFHAMASGQRRADAGARARRAVAF